MKNTYAWQMGSSLIKRRDANPKGWHYVTGLGLECLYRTAKALDIEEWMDWVKEAYDQFFTADGRLERYRVEEYSMDQVSPGKVFFDLLARYKDERYRSAIDQIASQLKTHPRTESGGFWHKQIYPHQMWLDGIYMYGTFYLRHAILTDTVEACLTDLVGQFELLFEKTYDEKSGLLHHAWDEFRQMGWCDPETGLSSCFWSRGLGWYCMALVDVLDFIPAEACYDSYRTRLLTLAQRLVEPVMRVQDPQTRLWYQVLDQGGRKKNYTESSGTAMFSYFLMKMARKGYVDDPAVKEAGLAGFEGLVAHKVRSEADGELHLIDICRGAGVGKYYADCPFRDGSYAYYTEREPIVWDNLQGVGPFLLAALEAEHPDRLHDSPSGWAW